MRVKSAENWVKLDHWKIFLWNSFHQGILWQYSTQIYSTLQEITVSSNLISFLQRWRHLESRKKLFSEISSETLSRKTTFRTFYRRIQNSVKHLTRSYLQKPLMDFSHFAKSSVLDVWETINAPLNLMFSTVWLVSSKLHSGSRFNC